MGHPREKRDDEADVKAGQTLLHILIQTVIISSAVLIHKVQSIMYKQLDRINVRLRNSSGTTSIL